MPWLRDKKQRQQPMILDKTKEMIVSVKRLQPECSLLGINSSSSNMADSSALQRKVNGAKSASVHCSGLVSQLQQQQSIEKCQRILMLYSWFFVICCHKANGTVGSKAGPPGCLHSFLSDVLKILNCCLCKWLCTLHNYTYFTSSICFYVFIYVLMYVFNYFSWCYRSIRNVFLLWTPLIQNHVIMGTLYQI